MNAGKEIAFPPFFPKTKYQNTVITFHVVNFSEKYNKIASMCNEARGVFLLKGL